jgi:hypothetical protein
MALDEAVETLSGKVSQYSRYGQKQREPCDADTEFVVRFAGGLHLSSLKELTSAPQKAFGRPALIDHACLSSARLEGIDYIDLEAFRAEIEPTKKGSNLG